MKSIVSIGGKLALICAISATLLGFVNAATKGKIEENKKIELERALASVTSEGKAGEETSVADNKTVKGYYPVKNEDAAIIGYVLKLNGIGYGGDMGILANFSKEGEVKAVVLMDNQETPGLGKAAEKPEYMKKFIGSGGGSAVPVRKDQLPSSEADSISGATITFIGVAKALEYGSGFAKQLPK